VFLGGFALGASKRPRHFRDIVPLGLRDETGEHQKFTASSPV